MNKFALAAAAALTVGTFGIAAIAQDNTVDAFDAADANNDNVVSWDEALGVYPTLTEVLYKQADANADGTLDEGEFTGLIGLTAGLDATTPSDVTSSSSDSSSSSSSSAPTSSAP